MAQELIFAQVALPQGKGLLLDYLLPPEFATALPGMRVEVPLGTRKARGWLLSLSRETSLNPQKLRPILSLLDEEPLFSAELLELAHYLAWTTASHVALVLEAMYPGGTQPGGGREEVYLFPGEIPGVLTPKQQKVVDLVVLFPGQFTRREAARLAGVSPSLIGGLLQKGVLQGEGPMAAASSPEPFPPLTPHQEEAWQRMHTAFSRPEGGVFLLQGVTGSGKTEVYLKGAAHALSLGKGVLFLVPEMALLPQTEKRLRARFGDEVVLFHSNLSLGSRRKVWEAVRDGRKKILLGPRSAAFLPFPSLGLLIMDEEHEPAYKQHEGEPHYHARDVVLWRQAYHGAVALLGSATPAVETLYLTRRGKATRLLLPQRVGGRPLPQVELVDMRGKRELFSPELEGAMEETLKKGQQVLLFLNRRGFAPVVVCRDCGQDLRCPHCDIALTYHRDGTLHCHYCDYRQKAPGRCPHCGSPHLYPMGLGTQRVEEEVQRKFPGVRVARLDRDAARRGGAYQEIYEMFRRGQVDVLVGTQMVAKGWDIGGVTLVGVVRADGGLHLPDFRAAERTLQLLVQVAGRAGRGHHPGRVIIQTLQPEHPALAAAVKEDGEAFFEKELRQREEAGWPPFRSMVRVVVRGQDEGDVEKGAEALAALWREEVDEVLGPAQAPLARLQGQFRWHMILLDRDKERLLEAVHRWRQKGEVPRRVQVWLDPDPLAML
ncbi:MAG: primosomal protein N' [Bacillota bacterium]|nr:primosomal protein N' [Bacillota bacterium]